MNAEQAFRKRQVIKERRELQRKADVLTEQVDRLSATLSIVEKQIYEVSKEIRDIARWLGHVLKEAR